MNKWELRKKSARPRTMSTPEVVSKPHNTSQKGTKRRVRSGSSPATKTESPSSNCATISRTPSSATISQLSDPYSKSIRNSPSDTNINRTPGTSCYVGTTPNSEVTSDDLTNETTPSNELLYMPERLTDKTFIYMYDEKEKTSKEVIIPKDLHVTLPILVQYEITEDTIRQVTNEAAKNGAGQSEPQNDLEIEGTTERYVTPTPALLGADEEDEMKNKGARIMQWLLEVQCE